MINHYANCPHEADIWISPTTLGSNRRKALLLDRDGVIVMEVNYLNRPEDVHLNPGIAELISCARSHGAAIAVITNQAGLARGLFNWDQYHAVASKIDELLLAEGCHLDVTVACPFHPDFTPGYSLAHDFWRKPGPGMLHLLEHRFNIDLRQSWMIGDNVTDIAAAKTAGTCGAIHVLTGHGARYNAEAVQLADPSFPVATCMDLAQATTVIDERFASQRSILGEL